jgi:hypothetical protein
VLAGGLHQASGVLLDQRVDVNVLHCLLERQDLLGVAHLLQILHRVDVLLAVHDHHLVFSRGIAQVNAHEEAVQLGLGQREGALVLDGVLGGQDHERMRHGARRAVHGHLPFLHRLQQGGLRLGRRPVDFVGQKDLGHDRPRSIFEVARLLVVHGDTGDVGGEQIGGELDAPKDAARRTGDAAGQHGLSHTWHVLDEDMAPAHEGCHRQLYLAALADDDPLYVGDDLLCYRPGLSHRRLLS